MFEQITTFFSHLFIVAMLFWMLFWDSEPTHPIRKYWIPKVQFIFIWLGLSHTWKMFSPDPGFYNIAPKIKFTFKDGSFMMWEPTPSKDLSVWEKIKFKKFHKLYYEVARAKNTYSMKMDLIDHLLDKYEIREKCVKAEVFQVYQKIPPFENQAPTQIHQQIIYTYTPPN